MTYLPQIIICAICAYATARFMIYLSKDKNENKIDHDELFVKTQLYINRADTIEKQLIASKMIRYYIKKYGQTPNATRLEMQLQNKRISIPELN